MSRVIVVRYQGADLMSGLSAKQYKDLLIAGFNALGKDYLSGQLLGGSKGKSTVVGMKPNCLTGRLNSTPVALADALS